MPWVSAQEGEVTLQFLVKLQDSMAAGMVVQEGGAQNLTRVKKGNVHI